MASCDHHTWLQASDTGEVILYDTGRLERVVNELEDSFQQKPSLWFFVGKRAKEDAIRQMFPWNNIKKTRRDGIATLRLETSRLHARHPILFAESEPYLNHSVQPETSLLCHEISSHRLEWTKRLTDSVFDALHARLLFPFVDILCVFADDFDSFDQVVHRLKCWASFGAACQQFNEIRPKVVIVKSTSDSSPSPTFEILENMDVEFSLRQPDLMNFFGAIIVLNLVKSELSPLARHRPLRDLLGRLMIEMQHHRDVTGCLYSAAHLNHFFKCTVSHTARTISSSIDLLRANCVENPRTNDTDQCISAFFELSRDRGLPRAHVTSFVASSLLVAAYPPETHSKSIRPCWKQSIDYHRIRPHQTIRRSVRSQHQALPRTVVLYTFIISTSKSERQRSSSFAVLEDVQIQSDGHASPLAKCQRVWSGMGGCMD